MARNETDDARLARMGLALADALEAWFVLGGNPERAGEMLDQARRLALSIDNGALRKAVDDEPLTFDPTPTLPTDRYGFSGDTETG